MSGREIVLDSEMSSSYATELNLVVGVNGIEGVLQSNEIVMAEGSVLEKIVNVTRVEVNEGGLVCTGKSQVGVRIEGILYCKRSGLLVILVGGIGVVVLGVLAALVVSVLEVPADLVVVTEFDPAVKAAALVFVVLGVLADLVVVPEFVAAVKAVAVVAGGNGIAVDKPTVPQD